MRRPATLALTRRVLDCVSGETLETAPEPHVEPAASFTDAELHRADLAMMRRVPHVVGWAGEVAAPGDYTTKDVAGTPVLIVRDGAGGLRAFLNACAHRGARVAAGAGTAQRFTCRYHAWSYGTDGRLAGVPSREMFAGLDLECRGLRPLPVSERCGLLTVGLDEGVDVEGALEDVADELVGFSYERYQHVETRTFDVAANWKLTVDVNFEGYHFPFLHRETLHPLVTNNSVFDTFGRHCRWAFPARAISAIRDVPEEHWPDRFIGTVVYGIFPSCVLIEGPRSAQLLRVYPGATPGSSVVHLTEGSHAPVIDEAEREERLAGFAIACQVLRGEDFPAAEECQRGLERGVPEVLVGRNEPLVQHLHRVWQASVGGES